MDDEKMKALEEFARNTKAAHQIPLPKSDYQARLYRSPINLPEAKSGKLAIKHKTCKVGERLPVVGLRQGVTRGVQPSSVTLKEPLRIHVLEDDDRGTWMTDMPEELNQIGELIYNLRPRGRVLVGGLGLGILAKVLANEASVDEVTVIERNADVIKLCLDDAEDYEVVQADIYKWLRESKDAFDFYLLDTWQGTGEMAWWQSVMPARRIIRNKFGPAPTVHCWAEDIMLPQVKGALMPPHPYHWMHRRLKPMTPQDADKFIMEVGLPDWEKQFGKLLNKDARA